MINLEQTRAKNALAQSENVKAKDGEGDTLSGFPSLIINNGLMATLAYSLEKGKQLLRIADAIAFHLAEMLDEENPAGPDPATAKGLLKKLTESDSFYLQRCTNEALAKLRLPNAEIKPAFYLQRCTNEALAFLSYLKRFAK